MKRKLCWVFLIMMFILPPMISEAQEYKLLVSSGTKAENGDNTLISAPGAGKCIVLKKFQVQNESSSSTTILLKHGSTTVYRAVLPSAGSGVVVDFDRTEKMQIAPNTALVLNLSGANSHNYTVWYTVERMK